ncbi:MAG: hypothetical protein ACI814_004176, partial [Mariniblastus sp.]
MENDQGTVHSHPVCSTIVSSGILISMAQTLINRRQARVAFSLSRP